MLKAVGCRDRHRDRDAEREAEPEREMEPEKGIERARARRYLERR